MRAETLIRAMFLNKKIRKPQWLNYLIKWAMVMMKILNQNKCKIKKSRLPYQWLEAKRGDFSDKIQMMINQKLLKCLLFQRLIKKHHLLYQVYQALPLEEDSLAQQLQQKRLWFLQMMMMKMIVLLLWLNQKWMVNINLLQSLQQIYHKQQFLAKKDQLLAICLVMILMKMVWNFQRLLLWGQSHFLDYQRLLLMHQFISQIKESKVFYYKVMKKMILEPKKLILKINPSLGFLDYPEFHYQVKKLVCQLCQSNNQANNQSQFKSLLLQDKLEDQLFKKKN